MLRTTQRPHSQILMLSWVPQSCAAQILLRTHCKTSNLGVQHVCHRNTLLMRTGGELPPHLFIASGAVHHCLAVDHCYEPTSIQNEGLRGGCSHVIICSSAGAGCKGSLQLVLTWARQTQAHPSISASVTLEPLQVWFGLLPTCMLLQAVAIWEA